jgi:cell division septal protein FtsQ
MIMDGEIEMHQPENNPLAPSENRPADLHRRPVVILMVIAVILVGAIIWIGNWAINKEAVTPPGGLTDAQKAEIMKSLQLPPGTPPMTQAQKDEIRRSLQSPPNTPPLTEAQKAEIEKSLKQ